LKSNSALPATPFMEAHYFAHDCFMTPDQLMNEAGKLAGIPGIIVQGRYDLLCPPSTAHALAAVWHDAEVRHVEGAGHTLYDPGVRNAVMKAIADVASRVARYSPHLNSSCPALPPSLKLRRPSEIVARRSLGGDGCRASTS
jgi:proline iminopeptidase